MRSISKLNLYVVFIGLAFVALFVGVWFLGFQEAQDDARQQTGRTAVNSAETSWMVATECAKGDKPCDAALKRANNNAWGVTFFEDGTAYVG